VSGRAVSLATQALQQVAAVGFPVTTPLEDKTTVGSCYVRVGVAIGTGATDVAIDMTRKPSGCFTINSSAGTLVYQTAGDQAASTGLTFVCRSTAATTATIAVV
jgi:hypothetical protein